MIGYNSRLHEPGREELQLQERIKHIQLNREVGRIEALYWNREEDRIYCT